MRDPLLQIMDALVGPGDLVADGGANRGVYSLKLLTRVGPSGMVHAFEPNPPSIKILRTLQHGRANLVVHPVALSDAASTADLHVPVAGDRGVDALATLRPRGGAANVVAVRTDSLDRVLADRDRPLSFFKCDVEGSEQAVLRGASNILSADMPVVLVEIEERHQGGSVDSTFEYLTTRGYEGYFLENGGLSPLDTFDVERHQRRFVSDQFVPYAMPQGYVSDFLFVGPHLDVAYLRAPDPSGPRPA